VGSLVDEGVPGKALEDPSGVLLVIFPLFFWCSYVCGLEETGVGLRGWNGLTDFYSMMRFCLCFQMLKNRGRKTKEAIQKRKIEAIQKNEGAESERTRSKGTGETAQTGQAVVYPTGAGQRCRKKGYTVVESHCWMVLSAPGGV
jgi:hypothetical protein